MTLIQKNSMVRPPREASWSRPGRPPLRGLRPAVQAGQRLGPLADRADDLAHPGRVNRPR